LTSPQVDSMPIGEIIKLINRQHKNVFIHFILCKINVRDINAVQFTDCKPSFPTDDEKMYIRKLRICMNDGVYFPSGATKLFDFLYLAGEDEATNLHLLSELGITHVINCAAGYSNVFCTRCAVDMTCCFTDLCKCVVKLTGQFADKPPCGQSSCRLVN